MQPDITPFRLPLHLPFRLHQQIVALARFTDCWIRPQVETKRLYGTQLGNKWSAFDGESFTFRRAFLREDKKAKRALEFFPTIKKLPFFAAREEIPQPLMHHIFTAIHQMQQLRWGKLAGM